MRKPHLTTGSGDATADRLPVAGFAIPHDLIRAHLNEILASPPFQSSKRSRDVLSYLVEQVLLGHGDQIKERTLGEDVFGKPDYDPSEHNMVRVAINELRRRLGQFYDGKDGSELLIEVPRGSYVPVFHSLPKAEPGVATVVAQPDGRGRWRRLPAAAAAVAVVAATAAAVWNWPPSGEVAFWQPVLSAKKPALVWATGSAAVVSTSARSEIQKHESDTEPFSIRFQPNDIYVVDQYLTYGNVAGIATIQSWLVRHGAAPELKLGYSAVPSDVGDRPLILFGSLNNPWATDLNRQLRFTESNAGGRLAVVEQQGSGRRWEVEWRKRGFDQKLDYGVITRIVDPASGQPRISIGGLTHWSSKACAEFLTSPRYWNDVPRTAPRGWERKNLQVVLEVRVVQNVPQSPVPVAWHFW